MRDLLRFYGREAPNRVFLAMLLGAAGGIAYTALIPIIVTTLAQRYRTSAQDSNQQLFAVTISDPKLALLFGALCLFILLARTTSELLLAEVAAITTKRLRTQICSRILNTPLADLERLGIGQLITIVTTDIGRIVVGAAVVPAILVAAITVVGVMTYLLIMQLQAFQFVLSAIVVGICVYYVPLVAGRKHFQRNRENTADLNEVIRQMIAGVKELKLNSENRSRYVCELLGPKEEAVVRTTRHANFWMALAGSQGDLLGFLAIGTMAFVFPNYYSISGPDVLGVVMILMYIMGPINTLMNSMRSLAFAQASLTSVDNAFRNIEGTEQASPVTVEQKAWDSVRLEGVSYTYPNRENVFQLGPLDLEIRKGEITFIVGGNGSGKSTLAKLIALLYSPDAGTVFFGATKIDGSSRSHYRDLIAALFNDSQVFDALLFTETKWRTTLEQMLRRFDLNKLSETSSRRISSAQLSDGQRKRLAMVGALLEDKQIYVFDEWAANQDPEFKTAFYETIVPELRSKKKAVVVISHDDRYFHLADHIVRLEEGRIIKTDQS